MIELFRCLRVQLRGQVGAAPGGSPAPRFHVDSPDIGEGATVPSVHVFKGMGCTGENQSPALSWHDPPAGTQAARDFAS